jgi:hypothetical protein
LTPYRKVAAPKFINRPSGRFIRLSGLNRHCLVASLLAMTIQTKHGRHSAIAAAQRRASPVAARWRRA